MYLFKDNRSKSLRQVSHRDIEKVIDKQHALFGGISLDFPNIQGKGLVEYKQDNPIIIRIYPTKNPYKLKIGVVTKHHRNFCLYIHFLPHGSYRVTCDKKHYLYEQDDVRKPTKTGMKFFGLYAHWVSLYTVEHLSEKAQEYLHTYYTYDDKSTCYVLKTA